MLNQNHIRFYRPKTLVPGPADRSGINGILSLLGLAAAPVFGGMAIITAMFPGSEVLCSSSVHGLPIGGMSWMYCLMCVFHLGAWVRLLGR